MGKLKLGIPIGKSQTMGACNPLGASGSRGLARSQVKASSGRNEQVKERSKRLLASGPLAVDDGRVALALALALEVSEVGCLLGHFST